MNKCDLRKLSLAAVLFLLAFSHVSADPRGLPGIAGVWNFSKVNDKLFRGAAPTEAGMQSLKETGARSIIDLRKPSEVRQGERIAAQASGMVYTNVPLHGLGAPSDEQVRTVLSLIDTLPSPVFIHCVHGCDRTGTIIACYRIARDQWSAESALAEAKRYGLSDFERGMKKYIRHFGQTPKKETPSKH